ncbi:MAG TPA: Clp protease N-terminal domain-containing protein, partial [Gaiellaceae bacterium]
MATLHVRNVPDELYELLRERAAANGRSIGAETCQLLYERLVAAAGRPRPFPLPGMRRRPVGPPGPFTRFTGEARQAVVVAQEEARALGHDHVGTEHLRLGVLAQTNPAAAKKLRVKMTPGDAEATGQIPFTPEAKRALELGLRAALGEGAPLIEPR